MKVLAIDQSLTNCACVIFDASLDPMIPDHIIAYDVFHSDKEKHSYCRITSIANQVREFADRYIDDIDRVALEGLAFGAVGNAERDLAGLLAAIIACLPPKFHDLVNVHILAPTYVKYLATGAGGAKKVDMESALPDAVRTQFGNTLVKDGRRDLADAYHVGQALIYQQVNGQVSDIGLVVKKPKTRTPKQIKNIRVKKQQKRLRRG